MIAFPEYEFNPNDIKTHSLSSNQQLPSVENGHIWNGRSVHFQPKTIDKAVVIATCCFAALTIASVITGLGLKIAKSTQCEENENCHSGPSTAIKTMAGLAFGFLTLTAAGSVYIIYKQDQYAKQQKDDNQADVEMANPS